MSRSKSHPAAVSPATAQTISPLQRMEDSDERTDVAALHAVVLREREEPNEGAEPVSLWLITFMGAVLFWGGFYLQRYSGGYHALVYNENASELTAESAKGPAAAVDLYALGQRTFANTCEKCHQANGQGLTGQYPSLVGSDWVLAAGPARIIRIVLDGLQGPIEVKGQSFNNVMVPWREVFSDQEIAAVLTYVRGQKDWGHNAGPITPAQVAAIREKTKDRSSLGSWTAPELQAVPEME
jgi:mono/diheme cytochrome c family protein